MTPAGSGRRPTESGGPPNRGGRGCPRHPWRALWAMLLGSFMIQVDFIIVVVANPSIMTDLHSDYDTVIWVTSAAVLAYAVSALVAGRLGDRFGPKNVYLIGLAIFTAASLWCGLSDSVEMLIAARAIQGIGASLLNTQTLSTITRTFPPERRGTALSVWGATAGIATLVGPLLGGLLVGALGWKSIFFVNVPIGVVGLALAARWIPVLPTHTHRFDWIGVALSGMGTSLVVFALQEGQSAGWGTWIWAAIGTGMGFLAVFVHWQSVNLREPLIPLEIFRYRDFALSSLGVAMIAFVTTAMMLPAMFYAQGVLGLSPAQSALLTAPMAVTTTLLAPLVGKLVDRAHPRPVIGFGFSLVSAALTWLAVEMTPGAPIWQLVLPFAALGVGMAMLWSPLAATASRNLPAHLAGACSGVYNSVRLLGAVLGSSGMAAFMAARIAAETPNHSGPPPPPAGGGTGIGVRLPDLMREPFSTAMSQSMLLPAFVALLGVVAALFMVGSGAHLSSDRCPRPATAGKIGSRRFPIDVQPTAATAKKSPPAPNPTDSCGRTNGNTMPARPDLD
ncbi:MFS transporter [Mycobacterium kansasii]|nr:MFS transporter [Mycobacterium kansasii]